MNVLRPSKRWLQRWNVMLFSDLWCSTNCVNLCWGAIQPREIRLNWQNASTSLNVQHSSDILPLFRPVASTMSLAFVGLVKASPSLRSALLPKFLLKSTYQAWLIFKRSMRLQKDRKCDMDPWGNAAIDSWKETTRTLDTTVKFDSWIVVHSGDIVDALLHARHGLQCARFEQWVACFVMKTFEVEEKYLRLCISSRQISTRVVYYHKHWTNGVDYSAKYARNYWLKNRRFLYFRMLSQFASSLNLQR